MFTVYRVNLSAFIRRLFRICCCSSFTMIGSSKSTAILLLRIIQQITQPILSRLFILILPTLISNLYPHPEPQQLKLDLCMRPPGKLLLDITPRQTTPILEHR